MVRQQLDVFGSVLNFVPLALPAWAKNPIPVSPSAFWFDALEFSSESFWRRKTFRPMSVCNGIHQKAHRHNAGAVHQTRSLGRDPPCLWKHFTTSFPKRF